jgi:hypothetical protein
MNKRMNQHGHIKCCKWVPWPHLDGSWFALYFHRQRNIKFSFRRHILYNKINLLVVPKARPLRTKFQNIAGMDPMAMATYCRKLIVTGIYQANSYQKFVMSYWIKWDIGYFDLIYALICFVTVLNKHCTASEMPESEKVKNADKMKLKVKKARENR